MKLPFQSKSILYNDGHQHLRITLPVNPDVVFDTITEEQYAKDKFLPYWAELWPSTSLLLTYLNRHPIPDNFRVCELGCGLGIISTSLALHHEFIVATDIAFHGCEFTSYNIMTNGGIARTVCTDWRHLPFRSGTFDLIIASDVLYEERWISPLLQSTSQLSEKGRLLVADPCRRFWQPFKDQVNGYGLNQRLLEHETTADGKTTVEILEVTKN